MIVLNMDVEQAPEPETSVADVAPERLLTGVDTFMHFEVVTPVEESATVAAQQVAGRRVMGMLRLTVDTKRICTCEPLMTNVAFERLETGASDLVLMHINLALELLATQLTL